MTKFKINLHCNDSLKPSTSDKNTSKFTEWVYDGSGAVSLYVNQRSLDVLQDTSSTPKYIWLLESKQIIQGCFNRIGRYDVKIKPGLAKDSVQMDKRNEADTYITGWWMPKTNIQDGIAAVFNEMKKEYGYE